MDIRSNEDDFNFPLASRRHPITNNLAPTTPFAVVKTTSGVMVQFISALFEWTFAVIVHLTCGMNPRFGGREQKHAVKYTRRRLNRFDVI